ncbi:tetraspanin-33-like isoform X2 [Pelobates fuscus]|uniref:tetraspanin-33-like isoform X2 n=1 Tax=Pelobates fuscus TaxID=191477 RepID=UPI002FE4EEE1
MRTTHIAKYCLFVSCYIFWVASGLMIAVGLYAKLSSEKSIVDSFVTDPSIILIAVGILMFAITFIGCMGALRDMHTLLKIFAYMLVIVLILQFVAAVLGFMFSGMVLEKAASVMTKAITRYRDDLDLQNFIDYIQKKFECCGVNAYTDWSQNIYFFCVDNNPSLESCGVPYSCCIREKGELFIIFLAFVLIYEINIVMKRRKSTVPMTTTQKKIDGGEMFLREMECIEKEFENELEYMEVEEREETFVRQRGYMAAIECEYHEQS